MIELLSEVLKGKSTLIKNKQYLSAESYIKPFIERFKDIDIDLTCNVKPADQVSITNNLADVVYNRVHIQAAYKSENEFRNVIGMIYGLDTKKPVAKFYRGLLDTYGNYISFSTSDLSIQEIEEESPLDFSFVDETMSLFNKPMEWDNINKLMIDSMKGSEVRYVDLYKLLGDWIDKSLTMVDISDFGKVKLATSIPINGYKYLVKDKGGKYFIEHDTNLFNVYQALLQALTDEDDLINSVEKTYLINKLLNL